MEYCIPVCLTETITYEYYVFSNGVILMRRECTVCGNMHDIDLITEELMQTFNCPDTVRCKSDAQKAAHIYKLKNGNSPF